MKTVMKYHKITSAEVNNEVELFRASEIIADDRLLKAVFIVNGSANNALVSCYIKSDNNYNLIPVNSEVIAGNRMAILQKGLIFNDNDIVCIKSNQVNVEFSLDLTYDNEVN